MDTAATTFGSCPSGISRFALGLISMTTTIHTMLATTVPSSPSGTGFVGRTCRWSTISTKLNSNRANFLCTTTFLYMYVMCIIYICLFYMYYDPH